MQVKEVLDLMQFPFLSFSLLVPFMSSSRLGGLAIKNNRPGPVEKGSAAKGNNGPLELPRRAPKACPIAPISSAFQQNRGAFAPFRAKGGVE